MNITSICIMLLVAALGAILFGYALVGYILIALVAVAFFFFYRAPIFKFVAEVKVELDKCSWPWDPNQTGFKKYKELRDSTVVVVLSVILLAGFVTSCDWILTHLVGALTGTAIMQ